MYNSDLRYEFAMNALKCPSSFVPEIKTNQSHPVRTLRPERICSKTKMKNGSKFSKRAPMSYILILILFDIDMINSLAWLTFATKNEIETNEGKITQQITSHKHLATFRSTSVPATSWHWINIILWKTHPKYTRLLGHESKMAVAAGCTSNSSSPEVLFVRYRSQTPWARNVYRTLPEKVTANP